MTKLYFTDPIKALYTMREFGVKFYILGAVVSTVDLHTGKKTFVGQIQIDFQEEYLDQVLGSSADIGNLKGKIYVAKESEHIFEPKDGDIGIRNDEILSYKNCHWNIMVSGKLEVDIIMRDGKHFFNPENEDI